MMPINSRKKYSGGRGTNFKALANGENGKYIPRDITHNVDIISGQLARLCINGILLVLIIWTMRV